MTPSIMTSAAAIIKRQQQLYKQTYDVSNAHVLLTKSAAAPVLAHALAGRLVVSSSGWGLLEVPKALVQGAFDALREPGVEMPPGRNDQPYKAHISVFNPADIEQIGGADKLTERGHSFHYGLGPVRVVEPAGWKEMSKVWFIEVNSPELEKLRKSYGLTALPKEGKHKFHISIAVKRKHILKENDVAKAAAHDPMANLPQGSKVAAEKNRLQELIDSLSDKEMDGIYVWHNDDVGITVIDVMDWGDGKVGERLRAAAGKMHGSERVIMQNEGPAMKGKDWIQLEKKSNAIGPMDNSQGPGWDIRPSPLDGLGLFASRDYQPGDVVVPRALDKHAGLLTRYEETDAARYTNHATDANLVLVKKGNIVSLVANQTIPAGTEMTVNYHTVDPVLGPGYYLSYQGRPYFGESTSGGDVSWIKEALAMPSFGPEEMETIKAIALNPLIQSWAQKHGLIYSPGEGNVADRMDRMRQQAEAFKTTTQVAPEDKPTYVRFLTGLANVMGAKPGKNQQLQAVINRAAEDVGTVAPYIRSFAPNFWESMHGWRGSAANLAGKVYQANQATRDPYTGQRGVGADQSAQQAKGIFNRLYGPNQTAAATSGLSASKLGDLYGTMQDKGLMGSQIPLTPEQQADRLSEMSKPTVAVQDLMSQVQPPPPPTSMFELPKLAADALKFAKTRRRIVHGAVAGIRHHGDRTVNICPYCDRTLNEADIYTDKKGWTFCRRCLRAGKGSIRLKSIKQASDKLCHPVDKSCPILDKWRPRALAGGIPGVQRGEEPSQAPGFFKRAETSRNEHKPTSEPLMALLSRRREDDEWRPRVRVTMPTGRGSYLLEEMHNPKFPHNIGKRRFPGGGVEVGETLQDAAIRELKEELGMSTMPEKLRYLGRDIRPDRLYEHYFGLNEHGMKPGKYQATAGGDDIVHIVSGRPKGQKYTGAHLPSLFKEASAVPNTPVASVAAKVATVATPRALKVAKKVLKDTLFSNLPSLIKRAISDAENMNLLEQLTHGQFANMDPAEVALKVRQMQALGQTTPGGIQRVMNLAGGGGDLAESLGLQRQFGTHTAPGTAAFGGAWKGLAGRQGFGGLTMDEAMALDQRLRMNAAASPVANLMAATVSLYEAGSLRPGTPGAEMAEAILKKSPVTPSGIDIGRIQPTLWSQLMEQSGVSSGAAWNQLRAMESNQEITAKHGIGDMVRHIQGELELKPMLQSTLGQGMGTTLQSAGIVDEEQQMVSPQLAATMTDLLQKIPQEQLLGPRAGLVKGLTQQMVAAHPQLAGRLNPEQWHELVNSSLTNLDQTVRSDNRYKTYRNTMGLLAAHRPDIMRAATAAQGDARFEGATRGNLAHVGKQNWIQRLSDTVAESTPETTLTENVARGFGAIPAKQVQQGVAGVNPTADFNNLLPPEQQSAIGQARQERQESMQMAPTTPLMNMKIKRSAEEKAAPVKIDVPKLEQSTGHTCGPATAATVLKAHDKPGKEKEIAKEVKANPEDGTQPDDLVKLFNRRGLKAHKKEDMSLRELQNSIDSGRPVVMDLQAWGDDDDANDDAGHYVTMIGYDAQNVYFQDPGLGKPKRTYLSVRELQQRWHDKNKGKKTHRLGIVVWDPDKDTRPDKGGIKKVEPAEKMGATIRVDGLDIYFDDPDPAEFNLATLRKA